jgi:uncharacterized protein (TIGR02145 family)
MNSIKIGEQTWAKEDLKVTHFRNGEPIPQVQDDNEWAKLTTAAYCITPKGNYLYNFYAVNDERGLAPKGWHIPTTGEWDELDEYGIEESNEGRDINFLSPEGFSATLNGLRDYHGEFLNEGTIHYWWTANAHEDIDIFACDLKLLPLWGADYGFMPTLSKFSRGLSVRCLKD